MSPETEIVLNTIKNRSSCRQYKQDCPKEELSFILAAGDSAPGGGNTKQTKILVFTNREKIEKLSRLAQQEFASMTVTENMYKSLRSSILLSKTGKYDFTYQAPVLILCANKRDYMNSMADCAVIIENMMIAASAFQLGTCYVNQVHWLTNQESIREFLELCGLAEDEEIYGGLVIGYPEIQRIKRNVKTNQTIWIQ